MRFNADCMQIAYLNERERGGESMALSLILPSVRLLACSHKCTPTQAQSTSCSFSANLILIKIYTQLISERSSSFKKVLMFFPSLFVSVVVAAAGVNVVWCLARFGDQF